MSIVSGSSSPVVFVADSAYAGMVHSRNSPWTVPVMKVFPEGWKHYRMLKRPSGQCVISPPSLTEIHLQRHCIGIQILSYTVPFPRPIAS